MECVYLLITGSRFSTFDAINLTTNSHYAEFAIQNFIYQFITAIGIATVLYLILKYMSKGYKAIFSPESALAFPLCLLFIFLQFRILPASMDHFIAAYRSPVSLVIAALENDNNPPVRQQVQLSPEAEGLEHLFFVVDESVTADFLTINNNQMPTTPFLAQQGELVKNFGIASSFTNYSSGSNVALYSGARIDELPDRKKNLLKKPNIFQFAKKAGYTTFYIDGQTRNGRRQNFMSDEDFRYIDVYIYPNEETPLSMTDFILADTLIKLAKSEEKTFVYYNKFGAHWPYEKAHPENNFTLASLNMRGKTEEIDQNYKASIRWTVDEFWKKLVSNICTTDSTIIVYTSDHGQSFSSSAMRHGTTKNPDKLEASVPLLMYHGGLLERELTEVRSDIYSHENIFPTLLRCMGYDKKSTYSNYGPSLFDLENRSQRYFISGDIFGRSPSYKNSFMIE